ncbi:MAG: hypothetical protein C0614_00005, partial [Desulfuromonas sp.]
GVGSALTSAFRSAEDALASFVTTGKIDFKGFADSRGRAATGRLRTGRCQTA